jgi:DNA-binding MarR family transcriptional regulator
MPNSRERSAIKQLGDEFFIVSRLSRNYVTTAMAQSGVPMVRSKLLSTLADNGPSRVTDLAAYAHTAVRSATQAVDALERDGLAVRSPDPDDRRATLVTITEAGREAMLLSRKPMLAAYDRLFGSLPAEERAALSATLAKLRAITE